jgi:hypothetical protein
MKALIVAEDTAIRARRMESYRVSLRHSGQPDQISSHGAIVEDAVGGQMPGL